MQNKGTTMWVFCKFLAFSDSRYESYQAYGHDKPRPHYEDVEFCMQTGIAALHRGYAEILASAVFISAKCRWCGEKLILTNVFAFSAKSVVYVKNKSISKDTLLKCCVIQKQYSTFVIDKYLENNGNTPYTSGLDGRSLGFRSFITAQSARENNLQLQKDWARGYG